MQLQPNISKTIFYSFLFALGGAPTLAMLIASQQTRDPHLLMSAFVGLSVVLVCIFVPIVLIQNTFLLAKRHNLKLEDRLKGLSNIYFALNIGCLIFWILFMFKMI